MSGPENVEPAGPLTVTHARIRLEQGDLAGARRLLGRLLEADPDDPEAQALFRDLPEGGSPPRVAAEQPPPPAPVEAQRRRSLPNDSVQPWEGRTTVRAG